MSRNLSNLPTDLYLSQQVRDAEVKAVAETNLELYSLVENAGLAAFQLLNQLHRVNSPAVLIAGSGNNGADAFVLARLLLEANCDATLMTLTSELKSPEAKQACAAFESSGGQLTPYNAQLIKDAKLVVDGILGTGLTGAVKQPVQDVVSAINASQAWVLSLDVPSGILADTGAAHGAAVCADATLTFGAIKRGLVTGRARHCCGHLFYAQVGFEAFLPSAIAQRVGQDALKASLPKNRERDSHKGDYGKVTVIGGDVGMAGAVRLAGEACLRAGAGLVTVVSKPEHQFTVNANRPELMFWGCQLVDMEVYLRLGWAKVLVLGPGLGKKDWGYNLFKATCLSDKPCVLDADALNLLSLEPAKQDNWVLTPHPGEAARLLNISVAEVEQDRFIAVSKIQSKYGGVVLLKGAGTIISDGHNVVVAPVGNPGLASGGCGDVLSGIIGALMAQGLDNFTATVVGVIVHGEAADLAAKDGERGMLASDLMPHIRRLVNC
ncbi:NAD(P)H-hydrate dehydratase [Shewanella gelidii]|uniref:Bifunctional NAD(P)H-hydrate repair enzyme n=1 Tax=Shewanella gelidii TaxID=1642821 RepID=A0A917JQT1_9GAMM|nr:NAD(P)H-hydrate dehydratase [Shewanella gelidii]MCL1097740.1 NAD(P)H-hydrate dehydratase [Shewanella gelidii]GGI79166.1 bifunctional NAD(P)H-hydrate repair enzyme [Shewanella gelidii]